jgi:hypothetical protein
LNIFKNNLNIGVVFNDQNQRQLWHPHRARAPARRLDYAQLGTEVPEKCSQVNATCSGGFSSPANRWLVVDPPMVVDPPG